MVYVPFFAKCACLHETCGLLPKHKQGYLAEKILDHFAEIISFVYWVFILIDLVRN